MDERTQALGDDLIAALRTEGFAVRRIFAMPISSDGVERRSALRESLDLVKNLLVFSSDEIDADSARVLVDWTFSWLRARREQGAEDDIAFVSVYGPDGKSVLMTVPVREAQP